MVFSFVTLLWAAVTTMVVAIPRLKNDHYAYKSEDPAIEVALDISTDRAALEVKCGGGYRTGWFELSRSEEDSAVIHRFPDASRDTHTYGHLLASVKIGCGHIIAIESPDLRELVLEKKGRIRSRLGGEEITLVKVGKFRWSPLIGGNFISDTPLLPIKQQFDILSNGNVHVRLGCDGGGDTGFMKYRLSQKNARRVYKLTRAPSGPSVGRLLKRFKAVCSFIWSEDNNYKKQLKSARFVHEEEDLVMYGIGIFHDHQERLHRRLP
ncbi:hypothetical protein FOZ62_030032 [Perkinsus olseni]|uniref:Uncharacterized protein n=1 Tax=Perkinsus olseni TaxID=32597 RepID=A0A7J6RP30_PEROL|nr:hypothetical protein FOZ62_030032 [Perkinsus olseni]